MAHDAISRRVDEDRVVLHHSQLLGSYEVLSRLGERRVDGHDVASLEQVVQTREDKARLSGRLIRLNVIAEDVHAKTHGPPCHSLSNTPHADDADGFAIEAMASTLAPRARLKLKVHLRDVTLKVKQ